MSSSYEGAGSPMVDLKGWLFSYYRRSFNHTYTTCIGPFVDQKMDGIILAEDEPLDVYSLPQMHTQPPFEAIFSAIRKLSVKPASWGSRVANQQLSDKDQRLCSRYLSSVISSNFSWIHEQWQRDHLIEVASKCLATRCGRTGDMTRAWNLWPGLRLMIHEPSLTGDNLGLKTWASSYLLAKRLESIMVDHPLQVPSASGFRAEVLELGSGTGLVGLAAAAIWKCRVVLTDLPEIMPNLQRNIYLNERTILQLGGSAEVRPLDWNKVDKEKTTGIEHFQFILAADPLYSPEHAPMLATVIDQNLQRAVNARVIIELPYRDEATKAMASNLRSILDELKFDLIQQGEEYGYDDWEEKGEQARIHCWWGIWCRRFPVDAGAKMPDSEEWKPIQFY